ncbi:hypothetical protein [Ruania zhangjianzhongii]|uniref:hypothetical protein n=1 Tax=Ruania zhangjianzhongii TaxID=2603206 RepID=UPI0011CB89EE|nr:hypothetical protein [Ruania zhangjianzhongii]
MPLHPGAAMRPGQAPGAPELIRHLQRAGNAAVAAHLARNSASLQRGKTTGTAPGKGQRKRKRAFDDEAYIPPWKRKKAPRAIGKSTKVRDARWKRKARRFNAQGKPISKADWGTGYEAQHIIPAEIWDKEITVDTGLSKADLVDRGWNGMMLPSGRKNARAITYKLLTKGSTLPRHITKGWAHPLYNAAVRRLVRAIQALRPPGWKWTEPWLKGLADFLRKVTKSLAVPHGAVPVGIDAIGALDPAKVTPRQ